MAKFKKVYLLKFMENEICMSSAYPLRLALANICGRKTSCLHTSCTASCLSSQKSRYSCLTRCKIYLRAIKSVIQIFSDMIFWIKFNGKFVESWWFVSEYTLMFLKRLINFLFKYYLKVLKSIIVCNINNRKIGRNISNKCFTNVIKVT